MGRTMAVAEWSEEEAGFVVALEATELLTALHDEDAPAETANEVVVTVPPGQTDVLRRAV